ncbi:hypothetical protein LZC95_17510 [Pendulispora brunnea]|uniref:Glycosyltransferase family 2 protein n=1 Tax=Pendulispora brunnea TaxID=2905690 RepID=A0ABZ2KLS9_9BACT
MGPRDAYDLRPSPLEEHFRARYVIPSPEALLAASSELPVRHDRLWAIVPMAEQQPALAETVARAAHYLSSRLPRGRVLFLDGGSCRENVAAARAGGAIVLEQDTIFDAIDWGRLLPILNLRRRPVGRSGQGFNVFAAHIALAALGMRDDDLVFQCDADVQNYEELAPLERLLSAWSLEANVRHAKLAQPGRNNEMTMAARAMQQLFYCLELSWVPSTVKQLARDVFMALAPDKWLTCGLYIVTGAVVRSRPFASGYLDAMMQAIWATSARECGWRNIRYVECPVRCRDSVNTSTKETLILSSVALHLQSIVMHGIAPHEWDPGLITQLNCGMMPRLCDIPEIGDAAGPVAIHHIDQDRLIPSVDALCEAKIIDLARVKRIIDG